MVHILVRMQRLASSTESTNIFLATEPNGAFGILSVHASTCCQDLPHGGPSVQREVPEGVTLGRGYPEQIATPIATHPETSSGERKEDLS